MEKMIANDCFMQNLGIKSEQFMTKKVQTIYPIEKKNVILSCSDHVFLTRGLYLLSIHLFLLFFFWKIPAFYMTEAYGCKQQ